jgi:hypothetical protein
LEEGDEPMRARRRKPPYTRKEGRAKTEERYLYFPETLVGAVDVCEEERYRAYEILRDELGPADALKLLEERGAITMERLWDPWASAKGKVPVPAGYKVRIRFIRIAPEFDRLLPVRNFGKSNLWLTERTEEGKKYIAPLHEAQKEEIQDFVRTREPASKSREEFQPVAPLSEVISLLIGSCGATDSDLRSVMPFKALRELDLSGAEKITSEGMKYVARLQELRELDLSQSGIADEGLWHLRELPSLRVLNLEGAGSAGVLDGPGITDKGAKALAHHTKLRSLDLSWTRVTHEGVAFLSPLVELRELDLTGTYIQDKGFKHLAPLQKLRYLGLGRTPITDEGMEFLAGLKELRGLSFYQTRITGEGMKYLAGLQELRTLYFDRTPLSDVGMKYLGGLKELRKLDLSETRVGDEGVRHLSGLKKLRELNLMMTRVTDRGVKYLSSLRELRCLCLYYTRVTDEGVKHLTSLKKLRKLSLGPTGVTESGAKLLREALPHCEISL